MSNRGIGPLVVALYFVSGAVGLAYQVLWARMLSLQFGVSIFGVVITAAAFMLGLGGGALFGSRWSARMMRPLRWFALLEGGVAVYALVLPFFLQTIQNTVTGMAPASLAGWYSLQAIASLILIMIPAFALGAGFPIVLRALRSTSISLARIYGVNTCGGAVGALLPLWLLPAFGWVAALWFSALLGLLVAVFAFSLSRRTATIGPEEIVPANTMPVPLFSIIAYAAVGAAALMLEVGWTRLFGMLLLRTEYVMAVILAVFLLGIGVGSLWVRWLRAPIWFDLLPLIGAGFALLSLWGIEPLAAWAEASEFSSLALAMWAQGIVVAVLTLPVTLILGAWLPLLSARLGDGGARLYGANALGAAVGALAAGFVLIPLLGTHGTVIAAALLLFAAGMTWARRKIWVALPFILLLAWPVRNLPPVSELLPVTQANSQDAMLHEDALGITHVTQRTDGQRLLLADLQRMDASSEPLAVISQQNQARLPLLLHPAPQKVLFLGMGTGISAAGALAFPNLEITAVELSAGAVIAADQWFAPVNADVSRKIHVVRDDARRFLLVDKSQRYDVIIGDLFHPDLVGRSTLLSRQQFARTKARLSNGGIFVQWLALNQFDPESLAAVIRSFQREFENAVSFVDGFRLAMVGRQGAAVQAAATLDQLERLDAATVKQVTGGEGGWTWLGRYWGRLDVGPGPVQDEWEPVIEYRLPRVRYGGGMNVADTLDWLLARRPDVTMAMRELAVPETEREPFERAYIATELATRSWLAQFRERAREGQKLLKLAYQANSQDRWISDAVADRMYGSLEAMAAQGLDLRRALEAILQVNPEHADSLRQAWQLEIAAGRLDKAEEYRSRLAQVSPLDAALGGVSP